MNSKVRLILFDKHIGNLYQDNDRIYLEQINNLCQQASPISIAKDIRSIETTKLVYLEKVSGLISDSLPGSFGNDILNNFFLKNTNKYPTISDKLLFIGDNGLGALRFEPSINIDDDTQYTLELKDMFNEAKKLQKGDDYHSIHSAFLVSAHSFVGGARSKAVCAINLKTKTIFLGNRTIPLPKDFMHIIIKYDDTANDSETKSTYSKIEYIYYLLAIEVGLNMSECYLVEDNDKIHFVTKRFDIEPNGKRYHIHSLAGLLEIDFNISQTIGYEDLLRTAVKLGAINSLNQLFLQMLFNYIFVNQDDHSRNFSFMCYDDFKWRATPAYDITFAKGERQTVEHQLSLYGKALSKINIDDVVKLATEFSIPLEFVSNSLEKLNNLKNMTLPKLLKKYNTSPIKQNQILEAVKNRTLQGALDE
jgi:serine/threonine-protein kinase HipA